MTDFKGFNPDKNLGASFNTNRQGKGTQPEQSSEQAPQQAPGDPWADQKRDPNHMLNLLNAQAKLNIPLGIENPSIDRAMAQFESQVSPERHSRINRIMFEGYKQEFGKDPSPEMLQRLVDNYLTGIPVIQQA